MHVYKCTLALAFHLKYFTFQVDFLAQIRFCWHNEICNSLKNLVPSKHARSGAQIEHATLNMLRAHRHALQQAVRMRQAQIVISRNFEINPV